MVKFVYSKRSIPTFVVMLMAFFVSSLGITTSSSAQVSLACSNQIQLSLGSECTDTIAASLFSSTDTMGTGGILWLELKNAAGTPVDSTSFSPAHGAVVSNIGTYTAVVHFDADGGTDYDSDNSCWSTLLVELKITAGTIDLDAGCVPSDSCSFSCFYLDSIFMDTAFTGNLGANPNFTGILDSFPTCISTQIDTNAIVYNDVLENDICNNMRIVRTWSVPAPGLSNSHSTTGSSDIQLLVQHFYIEQDAKSRVTAPHSKVQIACGTDPDPASIVAYLTSKTNPLSLDSALACAYPYILDTLMSGSGTMIPSTFDSIRSLPLRPGILNSSKTFASCNMATSYYDQTKIPICGKGYKLVRNWTVIDWCTQTDTSFTQIIDATGATGISMTMPSDTIEVSTDPWFCNANFNMDLPTVQALCSDDYTLQVTNTTTGATQVFSSTSTTMNVTGIPSGITQLIVLATDQCNNSVKDTLYVNVTDKVSPIAVAKELITVSLVSAGTDKCAAKIRTNSVDNNSYDACSGSNVVLKIKRATDHDSLFAEYVELNSADLTDVDTRGISYGIVKVVLRVYDQAGNFNESWTNVRVEDKNTDIFTECGRTNIAVDCNANMSDLIEQYLPIATSAGCLGETVSVEGRVRGDSRDDICGTGGVTVDYTANGKVICTKVFSFGAMDTVQIDSTVFPADVLNGTCTDVSFGSLDLSNFDLGCNLIGTTLEEETFEFESGPSCMKILRHFTVIDWCEHRTNVHTFDERVDSLGVIIEFRVEGTDTLRNGVWKHTQVVKISGGNPPVITGCADVTISADDNCEAMVTLTNSGSFTAAGGSCPAGTLNWSVTVDSNGDGIFDVTADVVGSENITATLPGKWRVGTYRVRWSADAACGGASTCFTNFIVGDDSAPVPVCLTSVSTAITSDQDITIWASDFIASPASDPCSSTVTYSFSETDSGDGFKSVSCTDLNDGISQTFEFAIYAHDESGNVGSCVTNIKVDDTGDFCTDIVTGNAIIAGIVHDASGENIESARVAIASQGGSSDSDMTDVTGEYAFSNVPMNYNYSISSEKNDDFLNGVSTLDLVLIQKHVLGLENLSTAYKVIAADANNDEKVSAIDLIELRKVILGVTAEFTNNDSWRFIDATQQFADINNPWPLQESLRLNGLDHSVTDMNFIGVKIGDVSGNAVANSLITSGRSNAVTVLNANDAQVRAGETFELNIDADVAEVAGIQLGLDFNGAKLNTVSSDEINISAQDYTSTESSLNLSWVDAVGRDLNGTVLTLSFTATTDGNVSDMVQFSNTFNSEIYTGEELETSNIQIAFEGVENALGTDFELFQNKPNPFQETTNISFLIGEAGPATLSIFDITGKMVYEVTNTYNKGMNSIVVDKTQLQSSGVLYYQLNYQGDIATKKMISID